MRNNSQPQLTRHIAQFAEASRARPVRRQDENGRLTGTSTSDTIRDRLLAGHAWHEHPIDTSPGPRAGKAVLVIPDAQPLHTQPGWLRDQRDLHGLLNPASDVDPQRGTATAR